MQGRRALVNNSPRLGSLEILTHALDGLIMILIEGTKELGKEADSIANVKITYDICID